MKTQFFLTLSAAALLAFTPAHAASEKTEASKDEAPAATAAADAKAVADTDGAAQGMTAGDEAAKPEGDEAADPAVASPVTDAGEMSSEPAHDEAGHQEAGHQEAAHKEASHEEAAGGDAHAVPQAPQIDWSFNGPFGTFDRPALQRGFQVYKQVCAACHSMNRLAYRNLAALGYDEAEIKAIAADVQITDGPNDEGEMFERPGRPSDHFKAPFANDNAARYANNGALPPDLSLITRARGDGSNYVRGLLTGYKDAPAGFALNPGMHYNEYFPGHQIAMAAPLVEGALTYDDGTNATVEQMASDVATFLTWASEPVMEQRKQTGVKALIFLFVFAVLMYLTKRKVWKDIH